MTDAEALSIFVHGEDAEAQRAFERLRARTVDALLGRVAASVGNREDAEDVVQQAYVRVWGRRRSLVDMGIAPWRAYLNRVALRCCLDFLRGREQPASLELFHDVPSEEKPLVAAVADAAQLGVVFRTADEVWLGVDPETDPAARTRRLLAAQMVALDGTPWDLVCRILGDGPEGAGPATRATIDGWLLQPPVVRGLAYARLYFSNQDLAAYLLERGPGCEGAGLDEPVDAADAAGWAAGQQRAIAWRYGAAMSLQQIIARTDCDLTPDELESLFAKCVACFPFTDRMAELLASPALRASGRLREYLSSDGLWKRLVFQYAYVDDASYRDILDRTAQAADQVGCTITERGTLKGWIAMKRLLAELAIACRERMGVDSDD